MPSIAAGPLERIGRMGPTVRCAEGCRPSDRLDARSMWHNGAMTENADRIAATMPREACPTCPVFGRCGGCQQLDVPYADQLAAKQREIEELFAPLAPADAFAPILGMDDPFRYRNKVISPYAPAPRGKGKGPAIPHGTKAAKLSQRPGRDGATARDSDRPRGKGRARANQPNRPDILTGMYERGTHRLIPTASCLIENEQAKAVTLAVRDIMERHGMEPYDEDAGTGLVRHAVVRVGHQSGEVLVTIVTNGDELPASKAFCRELVRRCPFVTTVVQNVNTRQTNVILGDEERVLYGPGFILDTLCGLSFRISSQSFYQVSAGQTEVLYDEAIRLAGLDGTQHVIDAYCGTGTIGLVAAARGAAGVTGVDVVESAIRDARANAAHNGIGNAQFMAADAAVFMRALAARRADEADPAPLVVMMDPPRSGASPEFLDALAALAPERVVYISCDPATQARDIRHLARAGYEVSVVQPVDMFPHTDHIESIALLARSEGARP